MGVLVILEMDGSTEAVLAAKGGDRLHLVREVTDLWFHCMIVLERHGLEPAALEIEVTDFHTYAVDWQPMLYALAVLTLVTGSVLAVVQTNVKRMLAYSSIAHAGYLLVGLVAVLTSRYTLDARNPAARREVAQAEREVSAATRAQADAARARVSEASVRAHLEFLASDALKKAYLGL